MAETEEGPLTPGAAEEILRHVLPTASVTEVVPRTGGQLSTVVEVRCTDPVERVIFKIYPDRWRWKQKKELHVYRLLARHGAGPVPTVVHSEGADGVLGRPVTVMTLLDGQPLSAVGQDLDTADVREVYRQLGACLAGVHRIPQDAYGYLTTRILEPETTNTAYMRRQFDKKLREFAELGGDPALLEAVEARVGEHAGLLGNCPQAVLCHNDFHEGNVLVARRAGGWTVTGFIDVENAIAADPLVDLAKTDYYAIRGDRVKREAFHEGYGALPPDLADRVGLYRLYHALELWDWFASIGRSAPLPGIAEDIRRMTA